MKKQRRQTSILVLAILCFIFVNTVFSFGEEGGSSIKIVSQPQSVSIGFGEHPTLTVEAQNVASYQWEKKTRQGEFLSVGNGTEASYYFNCADDWYSHAFYDTYTGEYYLRCKLTGTDGSVVYTNEVTVKEAAPEWGDFETELHVKAGDTVTLSIDTSKLGEENFCFWMHSEPNGQYTSGAIEGAKNWRSNTTTFTVTHKQHMMRFYLKFYPKNRGGVESKEIIIYVDDGLTITSQPQSVETVPGKSTVLSIAVENGNKYQWQYYSRKNYTWKNSRAEGAKTANLKIVPNPYDDNLRYRCIVTGINGDVHYSDQAVVTLKNVPVITNQPKLSETPYNKKGVLTVGATGKNIKYQWQYYYRGAWRNSYATGAKTATLTYIYPSSEWSETKNRAIKYRCVITSPDGSMVITNNVLMKFTVINQ